MGYIIVFLCAICIGSFLNVVIYRLPIEKSITTGRPCCANCNRPLKHYNSIPIWSYLLLGGKCSNCRAKISKQYILIEMVTGLIAVAIAFKFGFTSYAIIVFAFVAILIAIATIDAKTMIIPNELNFTIVVLSMLFLVSNQGILLIDRIAGFFIISVPMYLLVILTKDVFGRGDIKLIAVSGLILGSTNTILAMFIALLIGGSYAICLRLLNKSEKHMPFGPSLCVGIFVSLMFGNEIISWFIGLL